MSKHIQNQRLLKGSLFPESRRMDLTTPRPPFGTCAICGDVSEHEVGDSPGLFTTLHLCKKHWREMLKDEQFLKQERVLEQYESENLLVPFVTRY